jgi:hypothetical protein
VRIGGGPPFNGADMMAVAPDGRVAIVHFDPYSVEYVNEAGQRTRGQPIKYDRIKVSEGHKQEWRERQKSAFGMMISNSNGQRSAPWFEQQRRGPESWGGGTCRRSCRQRTLTFSNEGYLWVQRTGPAGQPPTFDVIDRAGQLAQRSCCRRRPLVGLRQRRGLHRPRREMIFSICRSTGS